MQWPRIYGPKKGVRGWFLLFAHVFRERQDNVCNGFGCSHVRLCTVLYSVYIFGIFGVPNVFHKSANETEKNIIQGVVAVSPTPH